MAKKYIDADLLREEIETRGEIAQEFSPTKLKAKERRYFDGKIDAYNDILSIIDSLQQEQTCDTCTNDKGCVTCKDGELWEGKEQPVEGLEEEYKDKDWGILQDVSIGEEDEEE